MPNPARYGHPFLNGPWALQALLVVALLLVSVLLALLLLLLLLLILVVAVVVALLLPVVALLLVMALLPGKPLFTSPEASASFFHVQSQLAELGGVDPLRCTKQVCGGSNRNGTLFVGYHRTGGAARLEATRASLAHRPRSAMARAFRQEMEERDRPLKVLPAFRYR